MQIITDTQQLEDANQFGEILREYTFTGQGYGCYSCFDVKPEFAEVPADSDLARRLDELLFDISPAELAALDDEDRKFRLEQYEEYKPRVHRHSNGSVHLAWYWDGDGTLLFIEGDKIAINTDCKKDYVWNWIKES